MLLPSGNCTVTSAPASVRPITVTRPVCASVA
ncbi:Uncharacterised protein [Bordetella pertussis]|nr:Uncharacterised protein [Bordetella pertussis]